MQTIKLKYSCDNAELIYQYINQYNHVYRYAFNRLNNSESVSYSKINLNNIDLLDSWFIQSAITDAKNKVNQVGVGTKVIFGSKKNFIQRCNGKISKEEFLAHRNIPLCSYGEQKSGTKFVHGNRKFKLNSELTQISLKLKNQKVILNLQQINSTNLLYILSKIYKHQILDDTPIQYKLSEDFIYISFDESVILKQKESFKVHNRVLGIDMNPNYIGWSIVDWKSENEFDVIKSGVYSFKDINDKECEFKKLKLNSSDPKRIYLNNKRKYEVVEVVKNIINKALYYKVETICLENLSIVSKDSDKGKRFNRQVNNQWLRNDFVNNLTKRCNIFGIKLQNVKAEYSSFIGNFLYRSLNLPDPVLASIEISRRGYEFISQYITKEKEIKKNIIQPDYIKFNYLINKSLEEFDLLNEFNNLIEIYYLLKNSKRTYRVSVTNYSEQFYRLFSAKSMVKQLSFDKKCIPL